MLRSIALPLRVASPLLQTLVFVFKCLHPRTHFCHLQISLVQSSASVHLGRGREGEGERERKKGRGRGREGEGPRAHIPRLPFQKLCKASTIEAKETYYRGKRDLVYSQKRPAIVVEQSHWGCRGSASKETYYRGKRDLVYSQKRHTIIPTLVFQKIFSVFFMQSQRPGVIIV